MVTAHTDVTGSQLRPPKLLEAQRRLACRKLTPTDFKRIEDRVVDEVLRLQEEAGLDIVTDVKMQITERRLSRGRTGGRAKARVGCRHGFDSKQFREVRGTHFLIALHHARYRPWCKHSPDYGVEW